MGTESNISKENECGANKLNNDHQEQEQSAEAQFEPHRKIGVMRAAFTSDEQQIRQFLTKTLSNDGLGFDRLEGHAPAIEAVTESFTRRDIHGGRVLHQLRLPRVDKQ